tara:strand:- start:237 stop:458 length:222 start_codon:yes stop_codon:yes gene_type:complete
MRTFIDKHLGDRTYRELAKVSGITENGIYQWKKGKTPHIMSFILICRGLEQLCDLSYEELVMDGLKHIELSYE